MSRVLALDYGSARCGAAVSDPSGTLATPLEPVLRPGTRKGFARVLALAAETGAERIVVGLPLSLSGADSAQTQRRSAATTIFMKMPPCLRLTRNRGEVIDILEKLPSRCAVWRSSRDL